VRILIVEDEMLVALQIEGFLIAAGHDVVGIADCTARALVLAADRAPELALVDVNLARGDNGVELAAQLHAIGIQILFASGNCPPNLTRHEAIGCLGKPFGQQDMTAAIAAADARMRGAQVTVAPPGLRLF
jgi:two-component system, response regulator PdtaR